MYQTLVHGEKIHQNHRCESYFHFSLQGVCSRWVISSSWEACIFRIFMKDEVHPRVSSKLLRSILPCRAILRNVAREKASKWDTEKLSCCSMYLVLSSSLWTRNLITELFCLKFPSFIKSSRYRFEKYYKVVDFLRQLVIEFKTCQKAPWRTVNIYPDVSKHLYSSTHFFALALSWL